MARFSQSGKLRRLLGLELGARSQFSTSLCSEHTYSNHSWGCLPQSGTKRWGEGILRLEDTGTLEEDTDSQDSNIPIDHGHLAWNCSIKIGFCFFNTLDTSHLITPRFRNSAIVYIFWQCKLLSSYSQSIIARVHARYRFLWYRIRETELGQGSINQTFNPEYSLGLVFKVLNGPRETYFVDMLCT